MEEKSIQNKIELLIHQLEQYVIQFTSAHDEEMKRMKEASDIDLKNLRDYFHQRIEEANKEHHAKILNLEEEISYLKELTSSQRLMMEDNLVYIKMLEQRLNSSDSY